MMQADINKIYQLLVKFRILSITVFSLILGVTTTSAQMMSSEKRIAFVVGNANYIGESSLRNPHNDALLIANVLKNEQKFTDIILLYDLNRRGLYDLARDIRVKSLGADAVVVYYSGHGMRSSLGNYLIPVDARIREEDDLKRDGINASDIVSALETSNARVALLVLDACRDNPYSHGKKSFQKGLGRMEVNSGNLLVAFATSDGMTADDGPSQNSPYAIALSKALRDTKNPVLAQLDEVRREVRQLTGNKQNPTRSGDLEANIYLLNSKIYSKKQEETKPITSKPIYSIPIENKQKNETCNISSTEKGTFIDCTK
jgi:uncharacterized protein